MQLYRGMDIGTAKVVAAGPQGAVPHHLLDNLAGHPGPRPRAEYQELAGEAIDDISVARPPPDPGRRLWPVRPPPALGDLEFPANVRCSSSPPGNLSSPWRAAAAMHERLAGLDPAAAGAILPSNGRRIVAGPGGHRAHRQGRSAPRLPGFRRVRGRPSRSGPHAARARNWDRRIEGTPSTGMWAIRGSRR